MKRHANTLMVTVVLSLLTFPALADTMVTMHEGSELIGDPSALPEGMRKAFENQEPTTAVYWFGGDRAARIGNTGNIISRLDRGETYIINDAAKTYSVIEMGSPEDSSLAAGTAELIETGETRTIGPWNAVGYEMTVFLAGDEPSTIMLWVSNEVDVDLRPYHAMIRATAAKMGFDWMLRYLEVDGFPVRQEVHLGPISSWQEVVAIDDTPAPAGIYEPPPGFTKAN